MSTYYVDSIYGDDNNSGLDENNSKKTLKGIFSLVDLTSENTIILSSGEYILDSITPFNVIGTLNIIGVGKDTIIRKQITLPWVKGGYGNQGNLNIYKLIWQEEKNNVNEMSTNTNITFNNVVLNNVAGTSLYGDYSPMSQKIIFNNCTFVGYKSLMQTDNGGIIELYNCYGNVGTGEGNYNYDVSNNVITEDVKIDSSYFITDKSVNDLKIGVHYGINAWVSCCFIIKQNKNYYSVKNDNYDSALGQYKSVIFENTEDFWKQNGISINILKDTLFNPITIDGEMFKPIDKFDNFSIVLSDKSICNIKGLKSDKELIISNQNLSIVNAETIHNFLFDIDKVVNGDCKFVISADNGQTWLSWNGSSWVSLTNTAPLDDNNKIKQYSKLSDSEKIQWDKLKEEIWSSGISTDITGIDYNIILTNKTIRFAFVLYRPTYDDNIFLSKTNLLYDKVGAWHKLSEDDIDIAINSNSCIVTPKLQNLEHVKVNILI